MDKAIRFVKEYMKDNYGGMLLPLENVAKDLMIKGDRIFLYIIYVLIV